MIRLSLQLLLCFFLCSSALKEAIDKVSFQINEGWQFKSTQDTKWLPATVPGLVHLDLIDNKVIQDPFWRDGEQTVGWIISREWEYKASFAPPKELLSRKYIRFAFHGLDTLASVSLNGKPFLESQSQFNRYYVALNDRSNFTNQSELHILFTSAASYNFEKSRNTTYLPGDSQHMWTRKAAYQFGWDWAPEFCVVGIWKPIFVEGFDSAVIEYAYPYLKHRNKSSLLVGLELEIAVVSAGNYSFSLEVSQNGRKLIDTTVSPILQVSTEGNYTIVHELDCAGVLELWYPNQFNRTQNLYDFEFKLIRNGEVIIDKKTVRSGLRTVELIQEPDQVTLTHAYEKQPKTVPGKSFKFRINGEDVFMKGANYVPPDTFMPRMTREKYRKYADIAKESNFNMLRIWGGGQYEADEFYDALDENGVMVWQDFMFANGVYPVEGDLPEIMKIEFEQQIKRLRVHPSMALYCGNNEVYEGIKSWGWQNSQPKSIDWYNKIFKDLIPTAINAYEKSGVPYWETSPLITWSNDSSRVQGDAHVWSIWHGGSDIDSLNINVPRFSSEFGLPAMPNIESIKKFTEPEDRKIASTILTKHQKFGSSWQVFDRYLERYFIHEKKFTDLEVYIYASQVLQGMAFQTGIEACRRSQPRCMGVLYWQFNDCWPVTSWSSVDYYQTWKAAQYRVKKYYENVIISTAETKNDEVEVYLICDSGDFVGVLDIEVYSMDGTLHWKKRTGLKIQCPTNTMAYRLNVAPYFEKIGNKSQVVVRASIRHYLKFSSDTGGSRFDHYHYFVKPKYLELKEPILSLSIDKGSRELIVSAGNIVVDIMLYIEDGVLELEENNFDMAPGEKRIRFKEGNYEKIAGDVTKIKYLTLWDTYLNTKL